MSAAAELAFGRIMRMASRPTQTGDVAEYERCRQIILDELGAPASTVLQPTMPLPGWNFGIGTNGRVE